MSKNDFHKKIGFGKMALACVFLFNPHFWFIDILPDFIGAWLLYSAVSALSPINSYFAEAKYGLKKFLYVTAARFAFSLILLLNNFTTNESMRLLYLFVCSALYLIFLLPALSKIRDGINYLTIYGECKTVKKFNDPMYGFTVVFTLVHCILTVLPEFSVLFKPDELELPDELAIKFYYNAGTYRLISILILTAVAVLWLVCVCVYLVKIKNDRDFADSLCAAYEEKGYGALENITEKTLNRGLLILIVSFVLSFNIFFENVNVFPNFIACLCIFAGVKKLNDYLGKAKKIRQCAIGVSVLSLAKFIFEIIFRDKYSYTQVGFLEGATNMYAGLLIFSIIEALAFAALSVFLLFSIKEIVNAHTGFLPDIKTSDEPNERVKKLHADFCKRIDIIAVFAGIKALTSIYYYISKINLGWYFEMALFLDIGVTFVYALFAVLVIKNMMYEISSRYMISN